MICVALRKFSLETTQNVLHNAWRHNRNKKCLALHPRHMYGSLPMSRKAPESTVLTSPSEVIDALGGTASAARLLEEHMQTVSNWRVRRIPPELYFPVNRALAVQGKSASPEHVFGMRP
jgi:hypothetical protein